MAIVNDETGEKLDDPRAISTVLEQIQRGGFSVEAGEAFAGLVRTCTALQRPGSFKITLSIKPDDPYVKCEARFESTPPKSDPAAAILWPDEAGNLHRSDPNQKSFDGF
jgi:hypothetical protein